MKHCTVGIITFMGGHRVNYLMESIHKANDNPEGWKVDYLLVDDGSHEPKRSESLWVASHWNIPIIPHRENMGIVKSWNDIAQYGNPDVVVLLNDDILVAPNWLTCLLFFLEKNEHVGAVSWEQNQIIEEDVLHILEYDGVLTIYRDPHTKQILEGPDIPMGDKPGRQMSCQGSAFGFTKEKYDLVGGFDTIYKSYYEDHDFGAELASRGYADHTLHYPRLYHMRGKTAEEYSHILQTAKVMDESRKAFLNKWGCMEKKLSDKLMPKIPARETVWLDENLEERRGIIH